MKLPPATIALILLSVAGASPAADLPCPQREFLEDHCVGCHDAAVRKGGLDLTALRFDPADPATFARWVTVHDRVRDGEMPPKKADQPEPADRRAFLAGLSDRLAAADRERARTAGRAVWRRLNRYEYENTLRDLLDAPWLQVKDMLPEDGEAHRFNKSGEALDVSHVQMARYLGAADYALRAGDGHPGRAPGVEDRPLLRPGAAELHRQDEVLRRSTGAPSGPRSRSWARRPSPTSATGKAPVTVGDVRPGEREQEAFGVVASTYEPIETEVQHVPGAGGRPVQAAVLGLFGLGRAGQGAEVVDSRPGRRLRRAGRPSR